MALDDYIARLRRTVASVPGWEVGYPESAVGPEFAAIVRETVLGSRDGSRPPRPLLDVAAARVGPIGPAYAAAVAAGDVEGAAREAEAFALRLRDAVLAVLEEGALPPLAPGTTARKGGESRPLVDPAGADRFRKLLTARRVEGGAGGAGGGASE